MPAADDSKRRLVERDLINETFAVHWPSLWTAKKWIARPLYPERDALRDHKRVLWGLIDFCARYGYWPAMPELVQKMGADRGAVSTILINLAAMGLVARCKRTKSRSAYEPTPLGWKAAKLKPFEPWIRRPRTLLTRIAHTVTLDMYDLEQAQKRIEESVGTGRTKGGARVAYRTKRNLPIDEPGTAL